MTLSTQSLPQRLLECCVPVLETERLVLRAPRLADAKAIARLANDRRVAENTARIPHPYHLDDAEQFIAGANRHVGEATFAIVLKGEVIGMCGVEPRDGSAEIGYWAGVPYWNHGFATEAVRAVIDHAFSELGHEALQAGARVTNPASRRVLEKCGFQWTGVGLYRIRAIKSSAPLDRFRLDRGLWASLKAWGRVREVA
ncbi:MAG TPA: GNAT family N-acetyltransferase [Xanthobacteraceae bacterium]|jgi:RimJ/RimL family protein N-acetyltransferase|nr:GNAT family N-acetyltransferase [Xanthobacteraceae bacterium]